MSSDISHKYGEEMIPVHVPEIAGNEWKYIKECLDTSWVSSVGSYVNRFEGECAKSVGRAFAVATVNGTSALHVALMVCGIKEGDEVLMPSLTFIASANAVKYVGASPVFMDVDPETWQLDPEQVRSFLRERCHTDSGKLFNKQTGQRVKAIMPVHILGHPVDMDPIMELADNYGLMVVEDAAEGMGAFYKGNPVGSAGHLACFSFNGNKIITTGGGGMIVTDDQSWADRARHLTTQARSHLVEYEHDVVGYNYRLTNIQAAMGCAQLESLDRYVRNKRAIARRYVEALEGLMGIEPMREAEWATSSYWMFTVSVEEGQYGMDSRTLMQFLADRGVMSRPLWQPMHLVAAHRMNSAEPCPVSEMLYRNCLSIPCSVGLTEDQQGRVIDALLERRIKS